MKLAVRPMPDQDTVDTLIVGAGLAGCSLAWRLQQAGRNFHIIGNCHAPSAYQVAAGVINPVTGRWMTKTWEFDTLQPIAEAFYRELEVALGIQIYHPIPLLRYCQNKDDAKRLGRRMRNPRYANVIGDFLPADSGPPAIQDAHGSFEIKGAAYVDLPQLIGSLQSHFAKSGNLDDADFNYSQLQKYTQGWQYGSQIYQRVIFCEGFGLRKNPWFQHLPFSPAKGETILLEAESLELPKTLYHHKKWILPYGDHYFRIGATYDESDLTNDPTPGGAAELMDALKTFIVNETEFKISSHLAGIRPGTPDARPLLGTHPSQPGLFLLNGLGSKGASLAPHMSQLLIKHIFESVPLPSEIDLNRINKIIHTKKKKKKKKKK